MNNPVHISCKPCLISVWCAGIQRDLADLASSNDAESESELRERTPDTEDSGAQSLPATQGLPATHSTFRVEPPHLQSFRYGGKAVQCAFIKMKWFV